MANDVLGNLKSYFSKLTEGEHSATEMASSLNTWLRESGESIKIKVEEEVHRSVTKMGFIKREEFDALKREVQALKAKPEKGGSVPKKRASKTKPPLTKKKAVSKTKKVTAASKSPVGKSVTAKKSAKKTTRKKP